MKRKYNYFYRIENLLNGKFYYGVHKTDKLNDGYFGSSNRLDYSVKKYGIENFEKTILKFFDNYKDTLEYEAEIVNETLISDVSCYNIALGGSGNKEGYMYGYGPPMFHKITGERIKAKNKKEYDLYWSTREYEGHAKGKVIYKDHNGKKYSLFKNDPLIDKLELISILKNRIHCRDKNNNFFIVEPTDPRWLNGKLRKSGSFVGRKMARDHKDKIGKANSIKQKGSNNSQYGSCWITNEKESKKIMKGDLIPEGWRLGRKIKGK